LDESPWMTTPVRMGFHLTDGRYQAPKHIEFLSNFLVPRINRGGARVLVAMPPRHGKSEHNSHWLPVWFLEMWPDRRIMLPAYEAEFAATWGRKVRNTINRYAGRLRVKISEDRSAADDWVTTFGGGMMTGGVGGAFVGRGANLLLPDDLIKGPKEANSETYRRNMIDWWQSTMYTRLEPGGSVIATAQRWHHKDLQGHLISEMKVGGERWEIINLPAEAEANDPLGRRIGEPLWEDRYNLEILRQIRRAVGSYVWNSQFQGHPTPRSGGYYKRNWFKIVRRDQVPYLTKKVRAWDLAGSTTETSDDPDFTVGLRAGIAENKAVYLTHCVRVQEAPAGVERLVQQTAGVDGIDVAIRMEQEPGQSGKDQIRHYARMLNAFDFRGKPASGEKTVRAGPSCAAAERGDIYLVEGPWVEDFLDELSQFDKGPHDDQVDALSNAYEHLAGDQRDWTAGDFQEILAPAPLKNRRGTGGFGLLQKKLNQR
jgi:predicted phage terminase large subunit-like protein